MHDNDIIEAIKNHTVLLLAGLTGDKHYVALDERYQQLVGMIELGKKLDISDTLLDFLKAERRSIRDRLEEGL